MELECLVGLGCIQEEMLMVPLSDRVKGKPGRLIIKPFQAVGQDIPLKWARNPE